MLLNILILLNKLDSYQKIYCYFCPVKQKLRLLRSKNKVFTYFLDVSNTDHSH